MKSDRSEDQNISESEDQNSDLSDTPISSDLSGSDASVLLNMEGLIKNHIASIDKLGEEQKKLKEMLDDIFANDPTYQQHVEKAKEATKVKTATKLEILKQPQAADLNLKIKSLKSQIAEQQDALSDYLGEYQRMSGLTEIEGEDGEMHQIVMVAKLIKGAVFTPR